MLICTQKRCFSGVTLQNLTYLFTIQKLFLENKVNDGTHPSSYCDPPNVCVKVEGVMV